jgi:hypothetical protein
MSGYDAGISLEGAAGESGIPTGGYSICEHGVPSYRHCDECPAPEQGESRVEVPNPYATGLVLHSIGDERERQTAKIAAGKIPWDCADNEVPSSAKLAVLVEEVGEVANALIEDKHVSELYAELIQVAAVAAAWAESLILPDPDGLA